MRDPVARQRPVIKLDEFERRLRQPAPQEPAANDDPLAELARLVGDDKDPYQQMFQEQAEQDRLERGEGRYQRNFKGYGDAGRADAGRQAPPPSRAVRTEPRLDMRPEPRREVRQEARQEPRPDLRHDVRQDRQDLRPELRREPRPPQPQAPQSRDHWSQQPARPEPVRRPPPPVSAPAPRIEPERAARPAQRPVMPPAPSIAQIRAQQQAPAPKRPVDPAPAPRQPLHRPAPQAPAPRNLGGDFSAIEAGLRGSIEPNFRTVPPQSRTADTRGQQTHQPQNYQMPTPRRAPVDYQPEADYRTQTDYRTEQDYQADYRRQQPQWDDEDEADYRDLDYRQQYQPEPADDDDEDWLDMHEQPPAARQMPAARAMPATMREPIRSRRLVYMTAAVVLVGMGGIGIVFASKHDFGSPHQIAMIRASTNPAKVQAPNDGTNTAMQDDSVFDKTPQPPPGGVANHEEQPVDLAQTNGNAQQGSDSGNASTIPVPTPPSEMPPWQQDAALDQLRQQQQQQAKAAQAQQQQQPQQQQAAPNPGNGANPGTQVADSTNQAFGLGGTIQSKKVKTLAVRPDGSVVADNNNNNDSAVDPNAAMQMPAAAQGSSPAPQGGDGTNGTDPNGAAQTNGADQQPASGATDATDADNGPSPVRPHHVKPMRVADADAGAADDAGTGSGDFAVQLAAPGSEAEAHRVMTKLADEYQAELGDHKLKFRRAKVGDKSIYRVRVGGLSKTEATSLCETLQAKGGTCFVAKD